LQWKKIVIFVFFISILSANEDVGVQHLSLNHAIKMLKSDNLEIKNASFDVESAKAKLAMSQGLAWGKLAFTQDIARSNDAGNVFGFKLASREATFGDFGAQEFVNAYTSGRPDAYTKPPDRLNYPDPRTHYQTKIKYEVPLFTGFKLTSYSQIMHDMVYLQSLEKQKVINEKIYQIKKSFYNMALLHNSANNLHVIANNIESLKNTTQEMIAVGYAKKVDLLEVEAKEASVARVLRELTLNQTLLYQYISFLLNTKVKSIVLPSMDVPMLGYSDETIVKNNIDIQKAALGLKINSNMLRAEKSVYYPSVGAFAELSTSDNSFLGKANQHKSYTVGARLTWNLFNGGIDSAKIENAEIKKLKNVTQLTLAKKGIALKVSKLKTEIEEVNVDIVSLKKELALSNAIYENYLGRYKEKLSSMNDVIIKQSAQIEKILALQKAYNKKNELIFALEKLANGDK